MVFKKKETGEEVEIPKKEEEKEIQKEEEKKEESQISAQEILINHENRLREIEATLYRLKSI